ncbi:MAG: serine/threonine protein kinase [Myxococcales bacterium]|nr:serine/threonine protein kinase [Myxococcales bacterium]
MTAASTLTAGDQLGRYRLSRRLGAGGMGEVWAADDPELGRVVAIKVLREGLGEGARLRREARVMAQLVHANVVPIHDVGEHDGRVYVAMALWGGGDLRAWMTPRRPWPEVVSTFVAAGRGLAAAHAAGLVHRDFKPDNVLVDGDRVAVTDFGIATAGEATRPDAAATRADAVTQPITVDADPRARPGVAMTAAGELIGTPAYMAPELHLGRRGGPAADQFAFCVALWEALYGKRPFGDVVDATAATVTSDDLDPAAAVALAIIDDRRTPAPPGVPVPGWLRRTLARGLDPDPDRRFPSMVALVAALEHGLGRRRRIAAAGGAATVVATLVAVAMWPRAEQGPRCDGRDQLAGAWDRRRATDVTAALVASGRPHAPATATHVVALLDAYAGRWATMRDEACHAARLEGRQSAELLDLRNACLDRRRADLAAVVAALADRPDGEVVDGAIDAVADLDDLAACADPVALRAAVPWPTAPAVRAQLDTVRAQLSAARAQIRIGRPRDARPIAAAAVAAAAATKFGPAWAEALAVAGEIALDLDDPSTARAELTEAVRRAGEAKDDRLAASASLLLYYLVGASLGHVDEATAMEPLVESLVERAGDPADRVNYLRHRAGLRMTAGDLPRARAGFEAALAAAEAMGSATATIDLLGDLASVALLEGRNRDAEASSARARAVIVATYGADHPTAAANLHATARALVRRGQAAAAVPLLEEALAIRRRALGDDHHTVTDTLQTLGNAARAQGDRPKALAVFRELLARTERRGDRPARATALEAIGLTESEQGDWPAARGHLEGALALRAELGSIDTTAYASAEYNLADGLAGHGACAEAQPRLSHVEQVFTGSTRAYPRLTRATCALATGDLAAAAAHATAVESLCAGECPPVLIAVAHAISAQAQWLRGDRRAGARAVGAARAALAALPDAAPQLAELDAWIATHHVR